jgi:membrane dipeptidase
MNNESAARAAALHKRAIVIDAHSDILMAIADGVARLGEDFPLPDPATWTPPPRTRPPDEAESPPSFFPFSPHTEYFGSAGLYSLPQMAAGGVTVQVCAIYLEDKHLDRSLERALEMTWWLHREAEDNPGFEVVTRTEDIVRLKREGKVGGLLAFEGLEPLGGELRFLDLFYRLGLRMASLTHNRRNRFADGPQTGIDMGGLTALGRQAVYRMNELGIVVDLAHTNEKAFWEILKITQKPVVFSHLSPYQFSLSRGDHPPMKDFQAPHNRARLEALAENGGVAGIIFFGMNSVDEVVDYTEELVEIMGPDHVGLGSDYYGLQYAPKRLETIAQLPEITRRLVERGYPDDTILDLLGGNFLRVFGEVWK